MAEPYRKTNFFDVWEMAWRTITGNRVRSLLLILGVSIGVTTLLAIFTIVNGLSSRIRDDVVSANRPYIYVTRFSGLGGQDPDELMRRPQLLPDSIEVLKNTAGVELVDYQVSNGEGMVLKYREEKTNFVQAFGSSEFFPYLFSIKVGEGRFFTAGEITARERVCVLGYGPAKDLFPKRDPIGKTLRIFGKPYRIVGTMQERGHIIGAMGENYVCVPWTIFEKDGLHAGIEDRNIALGVFPGYELDEVISNVVGSLRQLRKLRPGQKNDFDVIASETYGELIDKVTGGIALVLVVLSSIGLLVGGIGVMNIMLISVAERTREIGLRMAVGARRKEVLLQVLVEAGILTGMGGVLGICLGYLASYGMTQLLRFPLEISPVVTVGATLFSVSIGLFFGLYPANKAARLDPVVALGRE
ncbi:MAG: FtsX-like permease family protein [bacterium]|nr:FtsX-like permease family protein [bacterium]